MDADARFARCFLWTFHEEGGNVYTDRSTDRGGPTKGGITQATLSAWLGHPATVADVQALTVETISLIYRKDYWAKVLGDLLPVGVDLVVYDPACNQGPGIAARFLQAAVNVPQDGLIGPRTIAAANAASAADIIDRVTALRIARYKATAGLEDNPGWIPRAERCQAQAKAWALEPPPAQAAAIAA